MHLPDRIETEAQLEDVMTTPSDALIETMRDIQGDLLILGVAGKMGPTIAMLARRAREAAGVSARIIGVSRFSDAAARETLDAAGIDTIAADLLDRDALANLPDAPNVLYLAARKFGSTGDEPFTWVMNTYLPGLVAEQFAGRRIVALSTGNVYPLTSPDSGGPTEEYAIDPVGEYAQSCLGRERMFQYFSTRLGTPTALIRLNYAIDLRYGVLLDLAQKVHAGIPIPLAMGHVNVIWQGDANEAILRSFTLCSSPACTLNVTGPGVLSVRKLSQELGKRLGKSPTFEGTEAATALLNDADRYHKCFGTPAVPLERMLDWVAHWVNIGGRTLNKPTQFVSRDGKF